MREWLVSGLEPRPLIEHRIEANTAENRGFEKRVLMQQPLRLRAKKRAAVSLCAWPGHSANSEFSFCLARRSPCRSAPGSFCPTVGFAFFKTGGFEDARAGGQAVDEDGWMPLHHAIQSTVLWSQGARVERGLINLMSEDPHSAQDVVLLRAKTQGGRPPGWSPLHMA